MIQNNAFTLFFGDIAVFGISLFLALCARYGALPSSALYILHLETFVGIFCLWSAVFLIAGLYDTKVNFSRKLIPGIVVRAQLANAALAAFIFFLMPGGLTPKVILFVYLCISTVLIVIWRLFLAPFLSARKIERALIVGSGEEARALFHILNEGRFFKFVGAELFDAQLFGDSQLAKEALRARLTAEHFTLVIGDMHSEATRPLVPAFYELTFLDQRVQFMSLHQLYEQIFHRIPPSLIKESWLLENISRTPHMLDDMLKRLFDVVGALVLGLITLPIYPLVYLAVLLDDGGSLFYKTERVGRFNKPMFIYKFRTKNGKDKGADALRSTLKDTRVGRFLRTTRVDELPQFWNILRGDLSFIGPRPEMPALAAVYAERIPYYSMRHLITPGLSGWAQILDFEVPRSGIDVERTIAKLSFDLYYLKQRSFFLDLEIALKTIKAVLARTGT